MGKMPDVAPDNLIIVETAEVREDGWLYITGVVPPGDAADMLRAGVDQKRNGRACPPMTKARVNPGLRPVRTASTHVDGGAEQS